jgi:hypothetical protein
MKMMEKMMDYVVLVDNKSDSIIMFLRRVGRGRGLSNNNNYNSSRYMDMLRRSSRRRWA